MSPPITIWLPVPIKSAFVGATSLSAPLLLPRRRVSMSGEVMARLKLSPVSGASGPRLSYNKTGSPDSNAIARSFLR